MFTETQLTEKIGVDGDIIGEINDADLIKDFGIDIRLHRVKILKGIQKLKGGIQTIDEDEATNEEFNQAMSQITA